MANFLDDNGLMYLWSKIKTHVANAITNKVDKVAGKGLSTNDYTTAEKDKLAGIASGAEVNQNAFSSVKVGALTIAADGKTDTLEIAAGANVTLTADQAGDKVTIEATDTTYGPATGRDAGLMSPDDKFKLDNIETGANNYQHPTTDGNRHVPASGTANNGKFLKATGTAGQYVWEDAVDSCDYEESADGGGNIKIVTGGKTKIAHIPLGSIMEDGLLGKDQAFKLDGLPSHEILEATYAKKADLTGVYVYRGSAKNEFDLPSGANEDTERRMIGDVWNIEAESSYGPAGTNVAWDGSAWDALGGIFTVPAITNAELDNICK